MKEPDRFIDSYFLEMMGRGAQHNRQVEQDYVHEIVEEEQDRDFNISLPYSDFAGEWINEGENLSNAAKAFPLWRLSSVKCLGFLINIGADQDFDNIFAEPFNHNRVNHSLVVGRVFEKILRRNKASEQDILVAGAAGVLHDIATPGGGDAVKLVDKKNLDEEDWWWEVVEKPGWEYLQSIGTTREQVDSIIHNQGPLGEVLDIADKITYVMQDLAGFMVNGVWTSVDAPTIRGYNMDLQRIVSQDTALGDIYKTVCIDKATEQVYFSDPEKLRKFLELRAMLHRDIYLNWASQGRDMLVSELLHPFYSGEPEDGKLTAHDLRRMTDENLLNFLAEKYNTGQWGNGYNLRHALERFKPIVETFPTIEEAESRRQELERDSTVVVLGSKQVRRFNTGVSYNVLDENGDIIPFSQHDPICASRLEGIATATAKNFVFYANASDNFPHPLRNVA